VPQPFDPDGNTVQRSAQRRKALLPAKVVDRDGRRAVDCEIRNISDCGASIELALDQIIPNQLFLIEMRSAIAYEAEVRWRKPGRAGLRFLHAISLREEAPEIVRHLKQLCETDSPPTPATVNVTPEMTGAGVSAYAAWTQDNFPAVASEHDMVRAVFIAMYGTMSK
jgi:hypothetical protein